MARFHPADRVSVGRDSSRQQLARSSGRRCHPDGVTANAAEAIQNAQEWFEVNSGWAPPDDDELAEWLSDGVCRCPDECLVEPEGWCEHGLASWWLILRDLDPDR